MNDSFDALIADAAARYGLPFSWIKAVVATESNFDPMAQRSEPQINDESIGLMQLLTATARGLGFTGSIDELYDPWINIDLGARLLAQLKSRYGSFRRVYSAYNSGNPDRWETSSQVLHNVERAEEWLARVIEEHPEAAAAAGAGLLVLLALGIWFFLKR